MSLVDLPLPPLNLAVSFPFSILARALHHLSASTFLIFSTLAKLVIGFGIILGYFEANLLSQAGLAGLDELALVFRGTIPQFWR